MKRRDFTLADAARAHRAPLTVRHAEFFFFSFFFLCVRLILFWNKYIFYKKKEKAKVIILSILVGRPSSSNPPAEFASPRPVAFVRSERHFISILKKSTYWPMVIYTCSITYRILWCAQFGGDVLETLKIQQAASPRVRIVVGQVWCGASQLGKLIPVNWCDGASYVCT